MNHERPTTDYIQQYLSGHLPPDEQQAFETAIAENPELNEEVRIQGIAHYSALSAAKENWKKDLSDRFDQRHKKELYSPFSPLRYAAVAASLILIAAMAWWFLRPTPTHESLYSTYYALLATSVTPTANPHLIDARKAFHHKEFTEARTQYEKLLSNAAPKHLSEVWLYLGLVYLETGQTDKAIQQFRYLRGDLPYFRGGVRQKAPKESQDADWYLALAYLRQQQTPKSEKLLQHIIDRKPRHYYHDQALELKKKLQRLGK